MTDFLTELREIAGANGVETDPNDLAPRNSDGRGKIGACLACVRPRDAEGVAAVLRLAARHAIRVIPQGARTGLVGAATGDTDGASLLLDLARLSRPPLIDAINRSATVDAGVRLSALNDAARAHGLYFPVDLGADPSVGGMIAANTGGARFVRFGDVRRNLLGLDAILADGAGTHIRLGGALWKDNSGLDLKQLLVGSSGSLGVVVRATLALQPLPHARVTALLALADPDAIEALLASVEASCGALLTAFEGISSSAYEAALGHVPNLRRPFQAGAASYFLLVELSSGSAISGEQLEDILGCALSEHITSDGPVLDVAIDHGASLWAIRHAVPEGLRALGHVVGCDISIQRGDLSRFRRTIGAEIRDRYPQLVLCDFGHVGDGGLHFNGVWPHAAGIARADVLEDVRAHIFSAAVERFGGSFSAEHGIGPRNSGYYDRWTSPVVRTLAGKIQRAFASDAIGRVDFGPGAYEARPVIRQTTGSRSGRL